VRLGRPSLALVDVPEQEQRLRLDFGTAQLGRLLCHLEQLVGRLLEFPQHHRHVRTPKAKLEPDLFVLIAEDLERAGVVTMRLTEALAPFGAASCVCQRAGSLDDRRLDRTARHLA
jgi:hypothetical protein